MAGSTSGVAKGRRACRQCKIKRVGKVIDANVRSLDSDLYSSNAMKPLRLAVVVCNEVGSAQAMGSIYAGLLNMNASVLCRQRRMQVRVVVCLCSSHCRRFIVTTGNTQVRTDLRGTPALGQEMRI
jgi:hypothetical protein